MIKTAIVVAFVSLALGIGIVPNVAQAAPSPATRHAMKYNELAQTVHRAVKHFEAMAAALPHQEAALRDAGGSAEESWSGASGAVHDADEAKTKACGSASYGDQRSARVFLEQVEAAATTVQQIEVALQASFQQVQSAWRVLLRYQAAHTWLDSKIAEAEAARLTWERVSGKKRTGSDQAIVQPADQWIERAKWILSQSPKELDVTDPRERIASYMLEIRRARQIVARYREEAENCLLDASS